MRVLTARDGRCWQDDVYRSFRGKGEVLEASALRASTLLYMLTAEDGCTTDTARHAYLNIPSHANPLIVQSREKTRRPLARSPTLSRASPAFRTLHAEISWSNAEAPSHCRDKHSVLDINSAVDDRREEGMICMQSCDGWHWRRYKVR